MLNHPPLEPPMVGPGSPMTHLHWAPRPGDPQLRPPLRPPGWEDGCRCLLRIGQRGLWVSRSTPWMTTRVATDQQGSLSIHSRQELHSEMVFLSRSEILQYVSINKWCATLIAHFPLIDDRFWNVWGGGTHLWTYPNDW